MRILPGCFSLLTTIAVFTTFRNSENVEVLLRHGLSFPRLENYQNVKDPPTNTNHEHESRSVLLREVFLSPPELSNAITIQRGKGQIASNCPLPYLATLCK